MGNRTRKIAEILGNANHSTGKLAGANVDVSLSSYLSLPFAAAGNSWGTYGNVSTNTHIGGTVTFSSSLYFGTAASGLVSASGTIMFRV